MLAVALLLAGLAVAPAAAQDASTVRSPAVGAAPDNPAMSTARQSSVRLAAAKAAAAPAVPRYDHVVVVIMENHSADNIIANPAAPYINSLAAGGASMTESYGVTHPSQPNYIDLFSGSDQGVHDDTCPPVRFSTNNLGAQLIAAGQSFVGYSESMPSVGFTGCTSGSYARKHNPWADFNNVPAKSNQPLTSLPTDWAALPTVAMVVPNLNNDMHDGTIAQGDTWLHDHMDGYLQWARQHNSLLVLTYDEDDYNDINSNRIPTIIAGAGVRTGLYPEHINHYNVLRTLQDMYGLTPLVNSATAGPIVDVWNSSPINQPPVAAFSGSCVQLVCSVNGSASADPDGSIASYAWDWHDGPTSTGMSASHTFASAGAKTVTLLVTDDLGATGTTSQTLTATGPSAGQPFAADAFSRNRATGWGGADVGGTWTVASAANSSVSGGTGNLVVGLGQSNAAMLPAVSSDSDITVTFAVDKVATGNGTYVRLIGRHAGGNLEYQAQLRARSDGSVGLSLLALTTAGSTDLTGESVLPNASIASSAPIKVRFQVTGTSPTMLRLRSWQASAPEPSSWNLTATDSAPGLQSPGSVGLYTYLSSGSALSPVTVRFSDFSARPTNQPFAADTFARTVNSGWGTATSGGSWTVTGSALQYSVSAGFGSMTVPAGVIDTAMLAAVSSKDTDLQVTLAPDKLTGGNGTYITLIGRWAGTNLEYQARARVLSSGIVAIQLSALTGTSTAVILKPEVVPSGLTLAGGGSLRARFQVTGTAPTTIRLKVWKVGTTEPAAWQLTTIDAVAALQSAGSIGVQTCVSSSSTVTPVTVKVYDLSARPVVGN